jgi:hypothetical protein
MDVVSESGGLTTIKQGTDGCVYAMKGGYTTNGKLYRICPQGLGENELEAKPFTLGQPYPNPTNTTTTITYTMRSNTNARIALYDVFGREVAVLADGVQATGDHQLVIDPVQLGLAPGMYFCNMTSEGSTQSVNLVVE